LGRGGDDDNSVHVGMFDEEVTTAKGIRVGTGSADEFSWSTNNGSGIPAYIEVEKLGIQTLNVVMQQDGVEIDKIIITLDAKYDPSKVNGGKGPKSSSRKPN